MLYRDSQVSCHDIAYSTASSDTFIMNVSWYTHLPVVVRTIIAPAQHLNEDSTAPIAVTSVGSEERGVRRRNSSKSCWWKMAASASLQIWDRATETGRGTDRGLEHYQRALSQTQPNDTMCTQKHTPNASLQLTPQETVPWRFLQIALHSQLHPARHWQRHCPLL